MTTEPCTDTALVAPEARRTSETLAELHDIFGSERLDGLLRGLADEIERRFSPMAEDRETLGRDAHAVISVSGALGFDALARACVELERACSCRGDVADSRAAVAAEARRTQAAIVSLRARPV